MNTKQLDRQISAIICASAPQQKTVLRAVPWSKGETMEQAQQRQREKSDRIAAKLKANREEATA